MGSRSWLSIDPFMAHSLPGLSLQRLIKAIFIDLSSTLPFIPSRRGRENERAGPLDLHHPVPGDDVIGNGDAVCLEPLHEARHDPRHPEPALDFAVGVQARLLEG